MIRSLALCVSLAMVGFPAMAEEQTTDAGQSDGTADAEVTREVDLASAEAIFKKSCRACHGNKGQGAASYPSVSDKEPAYIIEMLERYRAGEKIGPNSILMIQHAKKLSDDDIADLAVYVTTAFE